MTVSVTPDDENAGERGLSLWYSVAAFSDKKSKTLDVQLPSDEFCKGEEGAIAEFVHPDSEIVYGDFV